MNERPAVYGLVVAAGRSERFGADKLWLDLEGRPVWRWAFEALLFHPRVDGVGIVGSPDRLDEFARAAPEALFVVPGGDTRHRSVAAGLAAFHGRSGLLLVHDGARPFLSRELVDRVVEGVEREGAACPFLPITDTVKERGEGGVRTLDRSRLMTVQTPQGARLDLWRRAFAHERPEATDDIALLEELSVPIAWVPGDRRNIKITVREDYERALLLAGPAETRVGIGYDVHRFSERPDRELRLGGILIPDCPGLEGHSDADVVIHAVVDALLGAASMGDIGALFPDTDDRWKGASSLLFLREAGERLRASKWNIVSVDISVIAERPRIAPYRIPMITAMAEALSVAEDRIGVKATTNERLGAIGRSEGIAAFAVATIRRPSGGIIDGSLGSER